MQSPESFKDLLFSVHPGNFEKMALSLFRYQAKENSVYRTYLEHLNVNPKDIDAIDQIPFLPVELFRNHKVMTGHQPVAKIFRSSGTTGSIASQHYVADIQLYEKSLLHCFRQFYGDPAEYIFLALLPSYLERAQSSLVYMAQVLIRESNHSSSGFFKDDLPKLLALIEQERNAPRKIFLLGVSFALLDLAQQYKPQLGRAIVMETGGMKGRREELIREELHHELKMGFGIETIHSEYGMTELLSQAYSAGNGSFRCPPWMSVLIRDISDPFAFLPQGDSGAINIIDFANLYSCSFIATSDIGRCHAHGSFEVLGRLDHSEIRGCSLLMP
ncbi:MAG: acyl transferase [Bacteroidia bacterium]